MIVLSDSKYNTCFLLNQPVFKKNRQHNKPVQVNSYRIVCLLFLVCISLTAFTQQQDSAQQMQAVADTIQPGSLNQLKQIGLDEAKKSIRQFEEDRIATKQDELIEKIKEATLAATNFVKIGLDTTGLNAEHARITSWYTIASDGVFTNTGTSQTNRNLQVSEKILKELLNRILTRKAALDKYYKDLVSFRNTIDSLNSDSALYTVSADSATAMRYIEKLVLVSARIRPADSTFKQALLNTGTLQTKLNVIVSELRSRIDQIENFQKDLSGQVFNREFSNIGDSIGYIRPFSEILKFSLAKNKLALFFYVSNNTGRILLLVLLIIVTAFFLGSLKKHLKEEGISDETNPAQLVVRHPVLSAIFLVLNLFQFILVEPVFVFNALLWTISAICLTIIFKKYISKFWMYSWLTLLVLFLLACADNLILQASRPERWFMLYLSIAGTVACTIILFKGHKKELRERTIIYFIALVSILHFASTIANICGRYNLSKTLLASGAFSVIIAILFLWTARLINEGLALAFNVYKAPNKKLFYINFEKVGNKVPALFYVLLIIGWGILVGRDIYVFRLISDPVKDFFYKDRAIGNYLFTIHDLFIFFLILTLSTLASRLVSFFASGNSDGKTGAKSRGIGSWLLLIRIGIITLGLFLAFAAAGISMDKMTIVISALSVGIGFGLQTLVNNLVSGLIISFEKPVNVGDIVEIGSRSGVMKSIGFRSSVIYTWEGADVIVPNGDLLNQHLVNWTLVNSNRRIDILVGVAYVTDLEKTRQILTDLVSKDERILTSPPPLVLVKTFDNSSIDMELLCWVRNIREWLVVKSDIMYAINIAFKANGIEIPFPQHDVHIRSVNNNEITKD